MEYGDIVTYWHQIGQYIRWFLMEKYVERILKLEILALNCRINIYILVLTIKDTVFEIRPSEILNSILNSFLHK